MSRAFVSEAAAEAQAGQLPERPVSPASNLVTARGLALIDAEISALQAFRAAAGSDDPARPAIDRDLRYWRARRASAVLVPPVSGRPDTVVFGTKVTIRREGMGPVTYRIVGEDEADPAHGLLSWTSPLADALLEAGPGDVVEIGGDRAPVTIEAVEAG